MHPHPELECTSVREIRRPARVVVALSVEGPREAVRARGARVIGRGAAAGLSAPLSLVIEPPAEGVVRSLQVVGARAVASGSAATITALGTGPAPGGVSPSWIAHPPGTTVEGALLTLLHSLLTRPPSPPARTCSSRQRGWGQGAQPFSQQAPAIPRRERPHYVQGLQTLPPQPILLREMHLVSQEGGQIMLDPPCWGGRHTRGRPRLQQCPRERRRGGPGEVRPGRGESPPSPPPHEGTGGGLRAPEAGAHRGVRRSLGDVACEPLA